ncbi:unnamed protein product, partial [Nesidiocoris tenuis]
MEIDLFPMEYFDASGRWLTIVDRLIRRTAIGDGVVSRSSKQTLSQVIQRFRDQERSNRLIFLARKNKIKNTKNEKKIGSRIKSLYNPPPSHGADEELTTFQPSGKIVKILKKSCCSKIFFDKQ